MSDAEPDDEKVLFHVHCTLELDMVVLAKDRDQAIQAAKDNFWDELHENVIDLDTIEFDPDEIDGRDQLDWLGEENIKYCTPVGVATERHPQLTILEYLDKLGIE